MINKRIVILGGGEAQLGLIKTANKLGLYTIVIGIAGDYPGYAIADKHIEADIFDMDHILKIVRQESADGVIMCCSDMGLSTLGYVCDQTGMPGISYESACLSSNKLDMKKAFIKNGVNTANFTEISKEDNYEQKVSFLNFPILIKAVNLQGSKGIFICHEISEVSACINKVFEDSGLDYCIAEEFIDGIEFGAQAFVFNGKITFIIPHGDRTQKVNGTNIPIEHFVPYDSFPPSVAEDIRTQINRAIKSIKLNNCAVNVDLIIQDGKPYIIELSGRVGANMLPELISEYLGINYYEMILRAALNENPEEYYEVRRNLSQEYIMTRVLYPLNDSIVKYDPPVHDDNIKPDIYVSTGDHVKGLPNLNRIGRILARGYNLEKCRSLINEFIVESLNIRILQ